MNASHALRLQTARRLFIAAAAVVALAACGGGGGGGGDGGEPSPAPTPNAPAPTPPAPPPPAPPAVAAVPHVAAGNDLSLALEADGTVASWGDQESGQLGNDVVSASSQRRPQTVVGLTDARRVAAGEFHAVALRSNGRLVAWGSNLDGKLGIGQFGGLFPTPQPVVGLTDVVAIAVGLDHSIALRRDGTVWTWGQNDVGQLGHGDFRSRTEPTKVPGLENVKAIAAGGAHSIAQREDGSVFAWGWNANAQLGLDVAAETVRSPTRVTALDTLGVVEIAAGGFHTLARTSAGEVLGWGFNLRGQTGALPPSFSDVPVPTVIPDLVDVVALAAGETHSMALLGDGTIRTWGNASEGRLGNGSDGVSQSTSIPQIPNVSGAKAIAAGSNHSLVLLADGSVACFGRNFFSACGRFEITDFTTPVEVGPGYRVDE